MTAVIEDAAGGVVAAAESYAWSGSAHDLAIKIYSQTRGSDGPRVVKVWLGGNANTVTEPAAVWPVASDGPPEEVVSGKSGGRRRTGGTAEAPAEEVPTE